MKNNIFPQALTIAGSDSGGGAGIQADLKVFQELKVFGMSVITAVTAQNTQGVDDIHTVPIASIRSQLKSISDDFQPQAFKIGMLGTENIITCVADCLQQHNFGFCVLDPVMIAKGGAKLLEKSAIQVLIDKLLPLADIVTPNILEAEYLSKLKITNKNSLQKVADKIIAKGAKIVIIKGGHSYESSCKDYIFTIDGDNFSVSAPRFDTLHTHGTGCTFSACITAEIAKGKDIKTAIYNAKSFITAAISHPLGIGSGNGPTNHWAYHRYLG